MREPGKRPPSRGDDTIGSPAFQDTGVGGGAPHPVRERQAVPKYVVRLTERNDSSAAVEESTQ